MKGINITHIRLMLAPLESCLAKRCFLIKLSTV
jgi:hypothetical protein